MLKQFLCCPVIPWIITNYNVSEPVTDSMVIASSTQTAENKGQIKVRNKKLELTSIIDEIKQSGKQTIIIEKKTYPTKHLTRYKQQTIATALAATTKYRIRYAILEVAGKKYEIELTETEISQTKLFLEKLRKTITSEKPPPANPEPQKCRNCWYKRYCPYT